jgi:hypothetical protein
VALALAGCAAEREPGELFGPSDAGVLVVDATLIVDQEIPAIYFTETTDPDRPFSLEGNAAEAAAMSIRWSEAGGSRELGYLPDAGTPGRYLPARQETVLPETTYDLRITAADGRVVTATTTTPSRLGETQWVVTEADGETIRQVMRTYEEFGEDVYFQPENQTYYTSGLLEARFPRPDVLGFQVGIFSLDEDSDFVIDPDFFDPEDFDQLERVQSSPPIEAANGRLRLPWFAVFFEGRYKLRTYAVDRNWYDLIRSDPDLGGGPGFGGNAGDGFERPIFHIEGGIGLFGSAAADSIGFYVHPRP